MFYHVKETQYRAKPESPDPAYARKLQEILGGQFGEMSVMMQYLFQGWNCRGPAKYKDMLLDIGTEEIGHVEMLSYMIAQLLESYPEEQEAAVESGSMAGAVLKGQKPSDLMMAAASNPQHFIVGGLGALPTDSAGYPWVAKYIISSGNLLADFRANLNAESQGRLQAIRMYELATDPGVKDMLHFMIARDTMHQNQWMAAIEDMISEGLDGTPCPMKFPLWEEMQSVSGQFWNHSQGTESSAGRWAQGERPDGLGQFEYLANPKPLGDEPQLGVVAPNVHGTAKVPTPPSVGETKAVFLYAKGPSPTNGRSMGRPLVGEGFSWLDIVAAISRKALTSARGHPMPTGLRGPGEPQPR